MANRARPSDTRDVGEDYVEPSQGEFGGKATYMRPKAPYDHFMGAEGVPIYRDIGIHDIRELDLGRWERTGGRGAYIQLLGTEELWGMYVVEIPPRGSLNLERHLYEEIGFVLEGRGSVEIPAHSRARIRRQFEWGPGSLFSIPLNAPHQIFNASAKRALLLFATTAAPVINLFRSLEFVFDCDWAFAERYSGERDYFNYRDRLIREERGRAMLTSSIIPDIVGMTLPLDNQRSPGYRRVEANMAGNSFYVFIGEHEVGRYAKAHYHAPSPVLVCIGGQGYTYAWPRDLSTTPWASGLGDKVQLQEYVAGGMVAAAPGGGDWFHQHFGTGSRPLRFLVFGGLVRWGAFDPGTLPGQPASSPNLDIAQGGSSIAYAHEDPHVRAEFERRCRLSGVQPRM